MATPGNRPSGWVLGPGITAAAVLAGLLVSAGALLSIRDLREALAYGDLTRRSLHGLQQIAVVRSTLLDAETAQRGYLLTADPRYLEPRENARLQLPQRLATLRLLTADQPVGDQLLEIEALIQGKMAELDETIAMRHSGDLAGALALVESDVGKRLMDTLRARLDALAETQRVRLEEEIALRAEHAQRAVLAMALVSAAAIALLAAVLVALNRWARDRRDALRLSAASEERLRVTLRSIGDGVIATDIAGIVVFMNPVAEALTGLRDANARGVPVDQVFRIVNEYTRDMVESPVSKVMRDGTVAGLANHTLLLARDGTERPIDDSGAPIRDGDGALMGVVLVFRDVTARRLSEESRDRMLRAELGRSAAEDANRAKDEFLAIVSHELRSPLNAAVSWLALLKSGTLDEALRARALLKIEQNLRHQATLTNDLLDVSRIVAGKLTIEQVALDVAAILQGAVEDKRWQAADAEVTLAFQPCSPVILSGDASRLSQVFSNLLSNAIKFTDAGGTVTVRCHATDPALEITIQDTGRGIAPDFLPHVFERFRQADSGLTRSHGGLGLGLAIAKHIVEQHGGSIVAESEGAGRGATFRVRLPASAGPPSRPSVSAGSVPALFAGLHFLVVEDHADSAEALGHRLRSRGATVDLARAVGMALERYDTRLPDLVISDLQLPDDNGYALLREIRMRDKEAGRHTVVIAVSGSVRDVDRQQIVAAGFDGFVGKPLEMDALIGVVAEVRLRLTAAAPR